MSTKMLVSRSNLTAIGAAIRSKNKSTEKYLPSEMGPAIEALEDPSVLTTKAVTANGTYDAADDEADGYSLVTVNVPNSYEAADDGKVVSSGALVAQTSTTVTENGTVDTTLNNSVAVNVPNTYAAADEGKVVSNGALAAQTSRNVTENGTYDTTLNDEVVVNVSGGGGGGVPSGYTYYNGYLLHTLPTVSGFEYVWIRKNDQTGNYDALFGANQWHCSSDASPSPNNWGLSASASSGGMSASEYKWYTASQTSPNAWSELTGTNYGTMGTDNNRDIIWTSHDILDAPNGNVVLKAGYALTETSTGITVVGS